MNIWIKKDYFWGIFVTCLLILHGCATAPSTIPQAQEPEVVLKDLCVRYGINCVVDNVSQVITLQKQDIEAKAIVGSDIVIVDNNKVSLSTPVRMSKGVVYIPADFKSKVISPLLKKIFSMKGAPIVMIDAGHGGHDPGGIGFAGTKEKDIVLDIAKRLKVALEERGIEVKMSRTDDTFLSLEQRANLVNQNNIDLFVSIHANISKSRKVKGLEVYCLRSLDFKEKKEALDPDKYQGMFRKYKMKQGDSLLKKTLIDMLSDYKNYESERLARYLAKDISSMTEISNRGDKQAGFYVLKYTLSPSVLIEVGFLSNRAEEKNLKWSEHRQKIAESIAESLARYARRIK
jgi:N-acetylmuramoyl-L-alanine amidase